MEIAVTAVTLALVLAIIAIISIRFQFKTYHKLKTTTLASDDRKFFKGQLQRRSLNAVLMLILAGLLGGAFLSGAQQKLDEILLNKQNNPQDETTDEQKDFVRTWTIYWMTTLGFLFFVVLIAIMDYFATSLYGRQQLRRIQQEQGSLLERDLAVYRQQRLNDRMKKKAAEGE